MSEDREGEGRTSRYGRIVGNTCFQANDGMVVVKTTDGEITRLTIKLRNERLTKAEFFRSIMRAYIDEDPLIEEFFIEYRKTKKNSSKRLETIMAKEKVMAKEISDKFILDPEDIEDIYDILEEESDI